LCFANIDVLGVSSRHAFVPMMQSAHFWNLNDPASL
jgi:hypothetical protein